jgi:ribosome-binding factor A
LQGRLAEALDLKRVPALRFVYDRDGAARMRAEDLMKKGE